MSPEQLTNCFRATAALPPELDLAEATKLFLPPPPPPDPRPWYKNPMIMLSALLLAFAAIFSLYPESNQPALTAFPIVSPETKPFGASISSLPSISPVISPPKTLPQIAITTIPRPFTINTAPATAPPPESVEVPSSPPVKQQNAEAPRPSSPTAARETPQSNTTFGEWEYRKKELFLKPEDPASFIINIALNPIELQRVKDHKNKPTAIKRAAGTLILKQGRRAGMYEFIPNANFRKQLNANGFGDDSYRPEDLPGKVGVSHLLFQDVRSAKYPQDLIWLRYFIADIDESYLDKLQQFGYTNEELQQTWQLAVAQIYPGDLEQILGKCSRMFTDRPPLTELRLLYQYALASWLSPSDSFPMPYAEYKAKYQADENGLFQIRPPATIQLIDSIEAPLFPSSITPPLKSFSIETTDKIADTLQVDNLKLLKVKGRIRLYLDKTIPEGRVIMHKKAGDALNVKRRSNRLIIVNECGADNVDITANPSGIGSIVTGKCAIMFFKSRDRD